MKKIAILHFAYPPNIGGVETVINDQANILASLDFDVLVLAGSGRETNTKIKLVECDLLQSMLRFNPSLQEKILQGWDIDSEFISVSKEIENILVEHLADRDTIIVHNMLTIVRNFPFISAFKNFVKSHPDKKIIVWVHDQTYIDGEKILDKELGMTLSGNLHKLLLTPIPSAKYVFISDTFKNLFIRLIPLSDEQTSVIPDGINVRNFLEIDDKIWNLYRERRLLESFPVILSPINILPRKNIEYSLEIISYLKESYPGIRYIISGDISNHRVTRDYYDQIVQKIDALGLKDNVVFLKDYFDKALAGEQIHDLYQLADIIFYFSKSENFGLPIVEALLTKSVLFASSLSVFREIAPEEMFFADTNKRPEDTAQKVLKYLEDNPQVRVASRMRAKFDMETIIKEKLVPMLL